MPTQAQSHMQCRSMDEGSISCTLAERPGVIRAAGSDTVEVLENGLLSLEGARADVWQRVADVNLDIVLHRPFCNFEGVSSGRLTRDIKRVKRKFDVMCQPDDAHLTLEWATNPGDSLFSGRVGSSERNVCADQCPDGRLDHFVGEKPIQPTVFEADFALADLDGPLEVGSDFRHGSCKPDDRVRLVRCIDFVPEVSVWSRGEARSAAA